MENQIIKLLKIKGLFNNKDIIIDFSSKCSILIGENGIGKTTILLMLNYLLKGDIEKLTQFSFGAIEIKLGSFDHKFSFSHKEISSYAKELSHLQVDFDLDKLKIVEKEIFSNWIDNDAMTEGRLRTFLDNEPSLANLIAIPNENYQADLAAHYNKFDKIIQYRKEVSNLGLDVVYLPTYRRIEVDIEKLIEVSGNKEEIETFYRSTFRDTPSDSYDLSKLIKNNKLMRFGMTDIISQINGILEEIENKSLSGYEKVSGKLIQHLIWDEQQTNNWVFDKNEISIILARAGKYLNAKDKSRILQLIETTEIVNYPTLMYILKSLFEIYQSIKEDDQILSDLERECNEFLNDKEFVYDKSRLSFNLFSKNKKQRTHPITLSSLSSGEKQIVSMLSSLYLYPEKKIVYLIDEPELSISIYWQEKLLPSISRAPSCKQLIAVTHSPFIFNNELKECAIGASEYVIRHDKES